MNYVALLGRFVWKATSMLELSDEIRMAESKPILEISNGKKVKI